MTEPTLTTARRPLLTWLLLLLSAYFFASWIIAFARGYAVTSSGHIIRLRESVSLQIIRGSVLGLQLAAGIQLFRLKLSAVPLSMALFLTTIALSIYDLGLVFRHSGRVATLVAIAVFVRLALVGLVVVYAARLRRNQLLNPAAV